jgi:hypothetical protein
MIKSQTALIQSETKRILKPSTIRKSSGKESHLTVELKRSKNRKSGNVLECGHEVTN